MSSAASSPSAPISASVVTTVKTKRLKRNSDDIGWDFGELVNEDNPDIIKCKFCPHVVTSGIYRLKCHVAGRKGVKSCSSAPPEAIKKCKDALDQVRVTKKARKEKEQEVRDSVNLDADGDEDEVAQSEALDEVGVSARRNVGPMDKFTLPMEPSDLMNTRTTVQQKQVSAIVKKRQHALKRFIAKWVNTFPCHQ